MNVTERKQQLIAEGALYRVETLLAREAVRSKLRPAALTQSAIRRFATAALAAYVGTGAGAGLLAKLPVLLPLAGRLWSLLAGRKGVRRAGLRLAVFGSAATAAYFYLKRKPH